LLRELRALDPDLHIKAFTAIEVRHLARRIFVSDSRMLELLREHGLGSITGGGAEIFDPWCAIPFVGAKKPLPNGWTFIAPGTNWVGGAPARCFYGHIETLAHRVDHLSQLRRLQMRLGGFTGFVPFAFEPQTTILAHIKAASAIEQLRNPLSAVFTSIISTILRVLGEHWLAAGAGLSQLWRGRFTRHNSGGKDFPHGRRDTLSNKPWPRSSTPSVKPAANRSSATVITDVSFHPKSLGHRVRSADAELACV